MGQGCTTRSLRAAFPPKLGPPLANASGASFFGEDRAFRSDGFSGMLRRLGEQISIGQRHLLASARDMCDPRHCNSLKSMARKTIVHEEVEAAMSSLEDRRRSQRVATLTAVDLFFVLVWSFGGLVSQVISLTFAHTAPLFFN